MSKLGGLFASLPDIAHISAENVREWLRRPEDSHLLGNEIGNRILYPHIVPVLEDDVSLNLGIIHEAVKQSPDRYFDKTARRILIPEIFLSGVPDLQKLAKAFADALGPFGCTAFFLKTAAGVKNLGTLVKVNVISEGKVDLWMNREKHQVRTGMVAAIPASSNRIDIKFESEIAELLGRKNISLEVVGGPLGLIVDTTI